MKLGNSVRTETSPNLDRNGLVSLLPLSDSAFGHRPNITEKQPYCTYDIQLSVKVVLTLHIT